MGKWNVAPVEDRMKAKTLPLSCGCHFWVGAQDKDGYGIVQLEGRARRVTRLIFELAGVKLSRKDLVCHTCDCPSCVNPDHLFIGDERANQQDAVAKGRHRSGTVMNPERAEAARRAVAGGESRSSVARRMGVSVAAISRIASGKRWNQ